MNSLQLNSRRCLNVMPLDFSANSWDEEDGANVVPSVDRAVRGNKREAPPASALAGPS